MPHAGERRQGDVHQLNGSVMMVMVGVRWCCGVAALASLVWLAVSMPPGANAEGSDAATRADTVLQSGKPHDLVIYGATPGGIACAIRAAREELDVLLVSSSEHLGGMLTNGLSTMDTLYNGARAPLYDELRMRIHACYRERYGTDSAQYRATQPGHPKTRYEAHVVENVIDELLAAEPQITIIRSWYPVAAAVDSSMLRSVTFQQRDGDQRYTTSADVFADCSYESDLSVVAGVKYRVGREARREFNEQHAGVIFMNRMSWPPEDLNGPVFGQSRRLNLFRYDSWYQRINDVSSGAADPSVQGYNMRTIITSDPANRVEIRKPSDYDSAIFRQFGFGNPQHPGLSMPNQKFGMNEPKLVGAQDPYVEGDWNARQQVARAHRNATLGLLWFRQHDPSVPESIRKQWREYGLPRDEFADNGHMPYEIYARETRRIRGRAIFTENDAQLAAGLQRAPIHADSISITEWFLDSHACTPRRVEDSELEGMVMLKNQTFPGQVSWRTLLPAKYDNLLVPVCLSSTHVGWGTIRLEPTWMSIGEAAAFGIAMAKSRGVTPAELDPDALVRRLADEGVMVSFFNDVEGQENADWYAAVQYLGTQGWFASYDARPDDALTVTVADAWIEQFSGHVRNRRADPMTSAQQVLVAERLPGPALRAERFVQQLGKVAFPPVDDLETLSARLRALAIPADQVIRRGDACRLMFDMMSATAAGHRD